MASKYKIKNLSLLKNAEKWNGLKIKLDQNFLVNNGFKEEQDIFLVIIYQMKNDFIIIEFLELFTKLLKN